MSKQVSKPQLPLDTKLKLIAIHKETFVESSKIITYDEYLKLKRNINFYYKAVQLIQNKYKLATYIEKKIKFKKHC